MTIRVLHLVKTSVGASWALRQMRELVKLGAEVHVAVPPNGPLVSAYAAAGVKVHLAQFDFPTRQPWRLQQRATELRNLVTAIKPDLIHSHFVGTTLTMRLALGRAHSVPRLFQVPGPLHLENAFFRRAELATAGISDIWVGSCQWTCECYRQSGIANDRIFLSYYGTDLEPFAQPVTGQLRRELQVSESTPLVGLVAYMYAPKRYLGQTRGLKGHEDLLDAVSICLKSRPDLKAVIIGGAWNGATAYENRVRAYGRERCGSNAIFLGTRHDVLNLYHDLNVAVHPSHSENVGGAVESLLMEVPTIATQVGGFPDLVIPRQTGWLVPPARPEQLAEAIMTALNDSDQARLLARAGQKRAAEMFDVRRTAGQMAQIYEQVLAHTRHG